MFDFFALLVIYDDFCYQLFNILSFLFLHDESKIVLHQEVSIFVFIVCMMSLSIREDNGMQSWTFHFG